jgi:hypothetical protein
VTPRDTWESLQNRWASGEPLSEVEERARREYASEDAVARRELELFAELGQQLERDVEAAPAPFVQRTLAALRGSRLRLVAADEAPVPPVPARSARAVLTLAAAVPLLLGSAWLIAQRGHDANSKVDASVATTRPSAQAASTPSVERSELVFASGEVEVGAHPAVIGKGTLALGEHVRTRSGHACLTIDPQIDVCLERDSELVLESLAESGVRVRVLRGTVVAALTARSEGRTFSLVYGAFSATAHGTVFAIDASSGAFSAQVSVIEGKVLVSRAGSEPRLLSAHSSLDLRADSAVENAVLGRSEEARFWSLLAPRDLWQGANLGVLEIGASEPAQRIVVDERGPFALPLSTFVTARRHQLVLRAASGAQENLEAEVEAGAVRRISVPEPARVNVGRPSSEPAVAVPSAATLLDEARQKLVHGDPRGARVGYERLRSLYPTSPEAFTVLVTLGKLELDLGAPKRSLLAFEGYLRHGGPLGPEALSGKIRALRALGRDAEERAAIHEYLSRYASGFDAPMLKKRLETLGAP